MTLLKPSGHGSAGPCEFRRAAQFLDTFAGNRPGRRHVGTRISSKPSSNLRNIFATAACSGNLGAMATPHQTSHGSCPLAFSIQGRGPGLMLVHGFGGDSDVWGRVQASLARDHTVVCVDLPGFRDGTMPPECDGSADFLAIGASLGALARELGLRPCTLVGHSMGAHLTALAVLQDPSVFRGWVVVDQPLRCGPPLAPDAWRRLEADPEGFFGGFLGAQARDAAQKRSVVQKVLAMETRALASYLRHLGVDDLGQLRIGLPLAVFTASAPPADLLAWSEARAYPVTGSVRFVWFPACGHWIMLDEPEAFESNLRDFEARLEPQLSGENNSP